MKITKKHYFLIFLFLLLAVVVIKNYVISDKSKLLLPTKEVKARQPESNVIASTPKQPKTRQQSNSPAFRPSDSTNVPFPVSEGEKDTDRKESGRENPFEPLIQSSPKSGKPTSEVDNREEVIPNKGYPPLVRLVGVITNDEPIAVIEVVGISYIVSIGDIVAEMKVAEIRSDEIVLIKEGEERNIKLEEE